MEIYFWKISSLIRLWQKKMLKYWANSTSSIICKRAIRSVTSIFRIGLYVILILTFSCRPTFVIILSVQLLKTSFSVKLFKRNSLFFCKSWHFRHNGNCIKKEEGKCVTQSSAWKNTLKKITNGRILLSRELPCEVFRKSKMNP